jgi:hypothetical protein
MRVPARQPFSFPTLPFVLKQFPDKKLRQGFALPAYNVNPEFISTDNIIIAHFSLVCDWPKVTLQTPVSI